MPFSTDEILQRVKDQLLPAFVKERKRLDEIDKWLRWEHGGPHAPRSATKEYKELAARAQTPWLRYIVKSIVQALYVDGYRRTEDTENAAPWNIWQANGMDRRQIPLHQAAVAYGYSYAVVLPGKLPFSGEPMPHIRGVSPRRLNAFYEDPQVDDWPALAIWCKPATVNGSKSGWQLKIIDDEKILHYEVTDLGAVPEKIKEPEIHDAGVCPVVQYANDKDLDDRSTGEVEPYVSIAARLDQTTFDRLVVQRYSSWVVRTIAGMTAPDNKNDEEVLRMRLRIEDILIAEDVDTKFGSLPATPLDGFINAEAADIKALAATSQTAAHEMLGMMANMSAEALAAAKASATARDEAIKKSLGESHEQTLRLSSHIAGDTASATDYSAQVRWRDTSIRSLAQAADALTKLKEIVPSEMLLEMIPGWTQQDVDTAKALLEKADALGQLANMLAGQTADAGDE